MDGSTGQCWQDTHCKTYLAMELPFFLLKSYTKFNCVENEQMSYFQLNFLSKVKLITFANYPINEQHIFVYVCLCWCVYTCQGWCTCTCVHMYLDAAVDTDVFLNHYPFIFDGLSLNLELTDWLDWSTSPGILLSLPFQCWDYRHIPKLFMGAGDPNSDP